METAACARRLPAYLRAQVIKLAMLTDDEIRGLPHNPSALKVSLS